MTHQVPTLKERLSDVKTKNLNHFQTYYELARIFISML